MLSHRTVIIKIIYIETSTDKFIYKLKNNKNKMKYKNNMKIILSI